MAHRDYITRSHLRLRTIVRLRWIAVVGQLAAVFYVYYGLGFLFPIFYALGLIALSIAINVVMQDFAQNNRMIDNKLGTWMLGYDIIQLALLLFLTGGIVNPFACLLVAPIAISASSLRTKSTVILCGLALASATLISFVYLPLPWDTAEGLSLPPAYRIGNWIAVLCATTFIGFFSWRIAKESRMMSAALAATEATLAREQKLSALDGLAAAAAHGLGTPLSTISVVAKELARELEADSPLRDDVELIASQAVRCREILQSLAEVGNDGDLMIDTSTICEILEEVAQPLIALKADINVSASPLDGVEPPFNKEPVLVRNPGIIYALSNIVENAVEFSGSRTDLIATWDEKSLRITIKDDGPGFSSEMLKLLGEPFITSRPMMQQSSSGEDQFGMGLGFFISKTLLERSGAVMRFGNRKPEGRGAYVMLKWPRSEVDTSVNPGDK